MASSSTSDRVVRYIMEGVDKSASKSLQDLSKQGKATRVSLVADSDAEAASFNKVRESSSMLRDAFGNLLGYVGVGGVALGMKDLIEEGSSLQENQRQLQNALKNAGYGYAQYTKLSEDAAKSSISGGFTRDQEIESITNFVRTTHNATAAMQANRAAVLLARGAHLSFTSAQKYVQQAIEGNVKRLQQYVGVLEPVKNAEFALTQAHQQGVDTAANESMMMGKLGAVYLRQYELQHKLTPAMIEAARTQDKLATGQEVLARLTNAYSGSLKAYTESTRGRMTDLENAFSELTASLGERLLPTVNKVISAIAGLLGFLASHKSVMIGLVGTVTALSAAWAINKAVTLGVAAAQETWGNIMIVSRAIMDAYEVNLIGLIATEEGVSVATKAWAAAQAILDVALDANPVMVIVLAVAALIAVTVEIIDHWKQLSKVAGEVWGDITGFVRSAWSWIKGNWPHLLEIITAPFTGGLSLLPNFFIQIKDLFTTIWHFIEHIGPSILNAITFPFRKAFDWIKGALHTVESPFGSLGHTLSTVLHPLGLAHGGVVRYMQAGGPIWPDTVPAWLKPGEGVVTAQGMGNIGGAAGLQAIETGGLGGLGGNQRFTISPSMQIAPVNLDGKNLLNIVVKYALLNAARGPSSIVGGSLTTGGIGLPVNPGAPVTSTAGFPT